MKGDVEELLAAFQHHTLHFDDQTPHYSPSRPLGACGDGRRDRRVFGQLHPDLAAARKLRQEVYVAEVLLDRLYRHPLREPRYQRISKFPAVERDFSFVFDDAVTFERIRSAIEELGLSELQKFVPAEIYRGEKVGAGQVLGAAPRRVPVEGAHAARRRSGAMVGADHRKTGIAGRRAAAHRARPDKDLRLAGLAQDDSGVKLHLQPGRRSRRHT